MACTSAAVALAVNQLPNRVSVVVDILSRFFQLDLFAHIRMHLPLQLSLFVLKLFRYSAVESVYQELSR